MRNEVVYALTGRFPVHVHITKAMYRYASSLSVHPRRATEIYKWAQTIERGEAPEDAKYRGRTTMGKLVKFMDRLESLGHTET